MDNVYTVKKLPSIEEIIHEFPLSTQGEAQVAQDKAEVRDILAGRDSRLLLVIGPCSAWPYEAVYEYAKRLKALSEKVKDQLKLVLRLYIQKPRTAKGWTGPVNQPDPFETPDVEKGAKYARRLMVEAIEMGLPIADEALFTHNAKGFIELLSWVAIGARSTEDQEHRIFASGIDCPVGFKNPTSGRIDIGVNSLIAAQHSHTAVFNGYQVETKGNPYAHLVLRGGDQGPNMQPEHLQEAKTLMEKYEIQNPAVLIDVSHDNCRVNGVKDPRQQIQNVFTILKELKPYPELRQVLKGFMIESYLKTGCQNLNELNAQTVDSGGLSVTDPCLGWEESEEMVLRLADELRHG